MKEAINDAMHQSLEEAALEQQLMMDAYFQYFQKTKFTFDLTEIYVSFNDLIVVEGIIKRLR